MNTLQSELGEFDAIMLSNNCMGLWLLTLLEQFNSIQYAHHRVSFKLRHLQKRFLCEHNIFDSSAITFMYHVHVQWTNYHSVIYKSVVDVLMCHVVSRKSYQLLNLINYWL